MKFLTVLVVILCACVSNGTKLNLRNEVLHSSKSMAKSAAGASADEKSGLEIGVSFADDVVKGMGSNANWEDLVRGVVIASVKAIPTFGPLMSSLIGLFWPAHKKSVWEQIKPKVKKMIEEMIEEAELLETEASLEALKLMSLGYSYQQMQYQNLVLTTSATAMEIGMAKVAAQSSLVRVIDGILKIQTHIHVQPIRQRVPYIPIWGPLATQHLVALKANFLDYGGPAQSLLDAAPLYADLFEETTNELHSQLMSSDCTGDGGFKTRNNMLYYDTSCSYEPGFSKWFTFSTYQYGGAGFVIQDGKYVQFHSLSKEFYEIKNQAAWKAVNEFSKSLPTREEMFAISSSIAPDVGQIQIGSSCVQVSDDLQSLDLVPCRAVEAQYFGMDVKGGVHSSRNNAMCLTADTNALILSECLQLPTQKFEYKNQKLVQDTKCVTGSLTLGVCSTNIQFVPASSVQYGLTARDCMKAAFDFSGLKYPSAFEDYLNQINIKYQTSCKEAQGSLSCPNQQFAWSSCVSPTFVANEHDSFWPEANRLFIMTAANDPSKKTSPIQIQSGQRAYCTISQFGSDPAPGKSKKCWEITACSSNPGITCGTGLYPNPYFCGGLDAVCTPETLQNPPSQPKHEVSEWGTYKGQDKEGTLFFMYGSKMVPMIIGRLQRSKDFDCNVETFFGNDPAPGKAKNCYFLPKFP